MHVRQISTGLDPIATVLSLRGRGVAWLDADGSGGMGARSYIGWDPSEVIEARTGEAALAAFERASADRDSSGSDAPRWIGWLSYDAAWALAAELGLRTTPRQRRRRRAGPPLARLCRYDSLLELDHDTGVVRILGNDERATRKALETIETLPRPLPARARAGRVVEEPVELHREAIVAALAAIGEGDVYQVNLARRLVANYEGDPLALFLAMRDASPVPLGAYLEGAQGGALLSRSMERFLRWDPSTREIESRPIKGTIGRQGADALEAEQLRADPKERAEHTMIVDLVRNDVSRIAELGSVEVRELMQVEPYSRLSHLVSTVVARTRPEVSVSQILGATFPPASVTGTPKLRAIELIDQLERHPRGAYCGAIGYVGRSGGLSLSVAIRTAVISEGQVEYMTGGGIVEASQVDSEVAETVLKARVFADALAALETDTPGVARVSWPPRPASVRV